MSFIVLWGSASQWCGELPGLCPVAASWQSGRRSGSWAPTPAFGCFLLRANEGIKKLTRFASCLPLLFLTTCSKATFDWLINHRRGQARERNGPVPGAVRARSERALGRGFSKRGTQPSGRRARQLGPINCRFGSNKSDESRVAVQDKLLEPGRRSHSLFRGAAEGLI